MSARGGFFVRRGAQQRPRRTEHSLHNVLNNVIGSYVYDAPAESFSEASGRMGRAWGFVKFLNEHKSRYASMHGATLFASSEKGYCLGGKVLQAVPDHDGLVLVVLSTRCYMAEMIGGGLVSERMIEHDEVQDQVAPHMSTREDGGSSVVVLESQELINHASLSHVLTEVNGYDVRSGALESMPPYRPVWLEFLRHGLPHPMHAVFAACMFAFVLALQIVYTQAMGSGVDIQGELRRAQAAVEAMAERAQRQREARLVAAGGRSLDAWRQRADAVYRAHGLRSKSMGADGHLVYQGGHPLASDVMRLRDVAGRAGDTFTMDHQSWRVLRSAWVHAEAPPIRPLAQVDFWQGMAQDLRDVGAELQLLSMADDDGTVKYTFEAGFDRSHEAVYALLDRVLKSAPSTIDAMSSDYVHGQPGRTLVTFNIWGLS